MKTLIGDCFIESIDKMFMISWQIIVILELLIKINFDIMSRLTIVSHKAKRNRSCTELFTHSIALKFVNTLNKLPLSISLMYALPVMLFSA